MHVAVDGKLVGVIFIADTLRQERVRRLPRSESGVKRVVMLTGDNAATANAIAGELGEMTLKPT